MLKAGEGRMDPKQWLTADADLEKKLCDYLEWYEVCEQSIVKARAKNRDTSLLENIKSIFLTTVNLNDISEYLTYYRPFKLNVNKLIQLENEILQQHMTSLSETS